MADDSDKVVIEVTPDDVKFIRKLRDMEDGAKKSGTKVGRSLESTIGDGTSRAINKLKVGLAGLAVVAVGALASGKVIEAAKQQENAVNAINTSLALAGTYSKEASESFQNLASSLQATSTFGDETILQMGALARNFTRTNEEAENLTRAAVDLSAATGMSLDGAVKNLGKTFAGLTGELGESVPALRALTAEQLKAGQAIDLIMARFGGAAAAQIRTFGGAWIQLQNIFGDLVEQIGMMITKSPVVVALMNKISDMFLKAGDSLKGFRNSGDVIGQMIIQVIKFGEAVNKFVLAPLEMAYNLVEFAFNGIRTTVQGFIMTIANGASKIVGFFAPNSELAQNLKMFADSSYGVFKDMSGQTKESFNDILNFDWTTQSAEFLEGLRMTAENAKALTTEMKNSTNANLNEMGEKAKKVSFDFNNAIGGGIAAGVQNVVGALRSGQNAFKAFGNAILGVVGDVAIQLGTFFLTTGLGLQALTSNPFTAGGASIAAGLALIAFGALMKSIAGSGQGGAAMSEGQPGSGIPAGGMTSSPSESTDFNENDIESKRGPEVRVSVQGNVFDSRETGLRIVEVINEAFDQQGLTLGRA